MIRLDAASIEKGLETSVFRVQPTAESLGVGSHSYNHSAGAEIDYRHPARVYSEENPVTIARGLQPHQPG